MIFIKVEVYGRHVKHVYEVKTCQNEIEVDGKKKLVFYAKPYLTYGLKYEYEKIGEFDGDNSLLGISNFYGNKLLFGDANVLIDYRNFRLDTGILELGITKNLSETDENKEKSEIELNGYVKAFNREMISSNEHLRKYCDVHKLNIEETDVFSLWDAVYPENDFNIMNGEMVKVPNPGKDDFMITGIATKADVSSTIGTLGTLTKKYCNVDYGIDATISSAMG